MAPHPCKTEFWGDGSDILLEWLDYFDVQLAPLNFPPGEGSVRHLTLQTYESMCVLRAAIEGASGFVGPPVQPWIGDANFDPGIEAEFRQATQVLTALLIADQYDTARSNPHNPIGPGWMWTPGNSGNPDQFEMERLVGPSGAPPDPLNLTLDKRSVLGRIRSALGG